MAEVKKRMTKLEGKRDKLTAELEAERMKMAQLDEEKAALTEASTALVAERDSLLAKVVELEASLARARGSNEESLGELREKLAAKDAEAEALQKKLAEAKTELARSQPSTARASDGAPFDGLEEDDEDAGARSTLSFLGSSPSAAEKAEAAEAEKRRKEQMEAAWMKASTANDRARPSQQARRSETPVSPTPSSADTSVDASTPLKGAAKVFTNETFLMEEEAESLREELTAAKAELEAANAKLIDADAYKAKLTKQAEMMEENYSKIASDAVIAAEETNKLRYELANVTAQLEAATKELAERQDSDAADASASRSALADANARIQSLENVKDAAVEKAESLQSEMASLKTKVDELSRELAAKEAELSVKEAQAAQAAGNQSAINGANELIDALKAEQDKASAETARLRSELESVTEQLDAAKKNLEENESAAASLAEVTARVVTLESERNAAAAEIVTLRGELEAMRGKDDGASAEDLMYLKNVVVKLLEMPGHKDHLEVLPVLATLLKFTPDETRRCRDGIMNGLAAEEDIIADTVGQGLEAVGSAVSSVTSMFSIFGSSSNSAAAVPASPRAAPAARGEGGGLRRVASRDASSPVAARPDGTGDAFNPFARQ